MFYINKKEVTSIIFKGQLKSNKNNTLDNTSIKFYAAICIIFPYTLLIATLRYLILLQNASTLLLTVTSG